MKTLLLACIFQLIGINAFALTPLIGTNLDKPTQLYVQKNHQDYTGGDAAAGSYYDQNGNVTCSVSGSSHEDYTLTWTNGAGGGGQFNWNSDGRGDCIDSYSYKGGMPFSWLATTWPNLVTGTGTGWGDIGLLHQTLPWVMNEWTTVQPPWIAWESCAVKDHHVTTETDNSYGYLDAMVVFVDDYSRNAQTTIKLQTGGKGTSRRQNLWQLSASAAEILNKQAQPWPQNWPQNWPMDIRINGPSRSISPTSITIDNKNVGSDGNLWRTYADGDERDVTPYVPGVDFYTFSVSPQKYHLVVQANGHTLRSDQVVPSAKHAIGEKINLIPMFVPGLPEEPQKSPIQWTLDGTYINAFKVWLNLNNLGNVGYDNYEDSYDSAQGLTNFRVDTSRLKLENTFAWWQTGSTTGFQQESIRVGMGLTFYNGQYVVVTAKGLIGMHQPTVKWNAYGYQPGIVAGSPDVVLGVTVPYTYDVGLLNQFVKVIGDSESLVGGRFAITQLIKRSASTTFGSWSDWRLDDSMPYNNENDQTTAQQTYAPIAGSPFGHARDKFSDGPFVVGETPVYSLDQFEQYFMYRSASAGSIWACLGKATWGWSGFVDGAVDENGQLIVSNQSFFHSQAITPWYHHPEFQNTAHATHN